MSTLNDNALTTLARVKLELGIDAGDTSKDDILCELINAYSDAIETLLGRNLKSQDYIESYPGTGNQLLFPKNYPVTNIASLTINGDELDSTEYTLKGRQSDRIFKDNGWPKTNFVSGMSKYPVFPDHNIGISYTAGYMLPADPQTEPRTLPYDIEKVILNMISVDQAQEGTSKGLKKFSISDVTWEFLEGSGSNYGYTGMAGDVMILKKYSSFCL